MGYEVTATRRRPASFDSLAGQEFVVATLKNSLRTGRIAHAYLFSGPRGVGKTSAARILARALNCAEGPTDSPCGSCANCQEVGRGNSLDVIEIDGASNTSVNDVREIKDEVLFAPNSSRYKIYIIDEVHMLSNSAFNALLKTIEEPPPYIVFVFATTEIHKVPATIRSRCQQFNFRLIPIDVIKGLLGAACEELGLKAEDDALLWIAKEATGSLRDAYTLFDQVVSFSADGLTLSVIRDKLGLVGFDRVDGLAALLAGGSLAEALERADEVIGAGVSIEQFVVDLADYFRTVLFIKAGVKKESVLGFSVARYSRTVIDALSRTQLEKALDILLELFRNLRYSVNPRFEFELALSRISSLSTYLSAQEIYEQIQAIRVQLTGGQPKPRVASTVDAGPGGRTASEGADGPRSGPGSPRAASFDEVRAAVRARSEAGGRTQPPRREDGGDSTEEDAGSDDGEYHEAVGEPAERPSAACESGISAEDRRAVIHALRKKKLTLHAALDKSLAWRMEEGEVVVPFDNSFSADVVRAEAAAVAAQIRTSLGRDVRIRVEIVDAQTENPQTVREHPVETVELARRIFRGEVIR